MNVAQTRMRPLVLDDTVSDMPDFAALEAAGLRRVCHRCTEGVDIVDTSYWRRRRPVVDVGLEWVAVHRLTAHPADAQAQWFLHNSQPERGSSVLVVPIVEAIGFDRLRAMLDTLDAMAPSLDVGWRPPVWWRP